MWRNYLLSPGKRGPTTLSHSQPVRNSETDRRNRYFQRSRLLEMAPDIPETGLSWGVPGLFLTGPRFQAGRRLHHVA